MSSNKAVRSRIDSGQKELERVENQLKSPTVMLLVVTAILGAFVYGSFVLNPAIKGDALPYTFVLIAEFLIIVQALMALWTILASNHEPRQFGFHRAMTRLFSPNGMISFASIKRQPVELQRKAKPYLHGRTVSVDVFIPVYGEDVQEIAATALAAQSIIGEHQTYILDDGKSDEVQAMAARIGVHYIRRPTNEGAKAGNINYALSHTDGDFFIIFDADFVAANNFIYETLPFFEDEKVAFVQTPQHYDNRTNMISSGAGFMQHVFYSLIQPGKNRFNAAFCVGTNVMFRRSAIAELGGINQESKSEDIWTSLYLHERGYRSIYIPMVLAIGKTPETIKAYSKQQLRWATGSFEIFLQHNPLFSKALTIDQRIQYLSTTTYYLQGFAVMLLLTLPPLQIFFNLTPISTDLPLHIWALYYCGFYLMQIVVAFYTMGGFKIQTLLLANSSFPIYVKAFFNALRGKDQAWQATNSVGAYDSPFNYIRVQVYIFVFLVFTTIVGVWKGSYYDEFSVALAWNIINTIVFGAFIFEAVRESAQYRRELRSRTNSRIHRRLKLIRRVRTA